MLELEQFKAYLLRERTSRGKFRKLKTVELHLSCLRRLEKNTDNLSVNSIESYLLRLTTEGRKGTYVNQYVDTLHLYGRFKKTNIYEQLGYYPEEEFIQATMSDTEIKAFLELPCPTVTRYDPLKKQTYSYKYGEKNYARWTLFFKILAYSGMRPGEVAHLTIDDVDLGRKVYVLRETKTNTSRLVPIAKIALHDVTEYITGLNQKYLFPSTKGGMNRQGGVVDDVDWGYNFHQRLKRLGIKRTNLRPNSLRPSFITRLLDEDVNLFKVQEIVGHKQIATTAHYTHLTTKGMSKAMNKDPLAREALPFYDRFKQFREGVRELLENYAQSSDEEQEMLKGLTNIT